MIIKNYYMFRYVPSSKYLSLFFFLGKCRVKNDSIKRFSHKLFNCKRIVDISVPYKFKQFSHKADNIFDNFSVKLLQFL